MSSHVIAIDIDVYSAFAVIFNILCLEVAYDSVRLFYWHLHYIYDRILYLCIMYYTVCYLTGIPYAVVRQIFMLFIFMLFYHYYYYYLFILLVIHFLNNTLCKLFW